MEKVIMTKETAKLLGQKLKFQNNVAEIIDDTAINLLNKLILNKLAQKLSDDLLAVIQEAVRSTIEEMPEIEI